MKLSPWLKKRSPQEWAMVAVIVMLLIMILTRWGLTVRTAGEAFRQRFTPPDSLIAPKDKLAPQEQVQDTL